MEGQLMPIKKKLALSIILLVLCSALTYIPTIASNLLQLDGMPDSQPHQCRFWAMISHSLPEQVVIDHLINAPYSLKNLGGYNVNGWGLAYYNDGQPTVRRGVSPANNDPDFILAAQQLAVSGANIGVGHVRLASSGAWNIPDPHPFMRFKDGKWWAFGHNGGVSGALLRSLIGPEYLDQNPPTVGANWSDPNVVDSDLYMLYILKCTEECGWNATLGIAKAVKDISTKDYGAMNFFLTDGETLWGFRRGNTLYYCYNGSSPQYSVIASQPPTDMQENCVSLVDYSLITLTEDNAPSVIEDVRTISFKITITGDVNGDGRVGVKDLYTTALAFGSFPGHPRWNANVDINNDLQIDVKDYYMISRNFGKTEP
jgi:Glutamine amidotransferases class-II